MCALLGITVAASPALAVKANPSFTQKLAQTLMVYRKGNDRFEVGVRSDLEVLDLHAERGPLGDRWQVTVALKPGLLKTGPVNGSIVIETNDPEFPRLRVPVTGEIAPN